MFASDIFDQGLISKIKNAYNSMSKQPTKKTGKGCEDIPPKKTYKRSIDTS